MAKEAVRTTWIKRMKTLQPSDPFFKVCFTDDEEIHGDVTLQVSGRKKESTTGALASLRTGAPGAGINTLRKNSLLGQQSGGDIKAQMNAADWDRRFE